MKIFICCSKANYPYVMRAKEELEKGGHVVTPPNKFENPVAEEKMKNKSAREHAAWKADMLREQEQKVKVNDAILVLNFDKGEEKNYIGGATFLEMFKAWELGKPIYLYNPVPDGILHDEILGMAPIVLNGDLTLI
jgi:hypothetical protein